MRHPTFKAGPALPKDLRALPKGHWNYALHREPADSEPVWARASDIKHIASALPRPLVLLNGAFDLLHINHMRALFAAKRKGATVVVALDTDDKICREKGPARPIMTYIERASTLAYMPVDVIVEIRDKRDMNTVMRELAPDFRVQGAEYKDQASRYPNTPKLLVRNGKLHTSSLIERIAKRYAKS